MDEVRVLQPVIMHGKPGRWKQYSRALSVNACNPTYALRGSMTEAPYSYSRHDVFSVKRNGSGRDVSSTRNETKVHGNS